MTPRIRAQLFLLVVASLASACSAPEDAVAPRYQPVDRAPVRLGPEAFAVTTAPLGRAVATIDGETRAVVSPPTTENVFSALGLSPESGVIRTRLTQDLLERLPAGSVGLRVQSYPAAMPDELLEDMVGKTPFKQIASGWTITRDADGGLLSFTPRPTERKSRYNLHLDSVLAGRTRLESDPFDLPAGTTIELAYGLTTKTDAPGFVPVRFRVELRCRTEEDGNDDASQNGEAPTVIADETIGAVTNPGWSDTSFTRESTGAGCHLSLDARDLEGSAAPGAVFSAPRFVAPERDDGTNLVLISLDTLRADHLSGYGYPRATSPRIDAELIARGTKFDDVTTTYSRTDVSHMSLFSGLYREARPNPRWLDANTPVPLLAERLRDAGFDTAAFTEDGLISGSFGFWWGFEHFVEFNVDEVAQGASTFERARHFLRERGDRQFFLFVHTYKTHAPYRSADAYRSLFSDPAEWERPEMQIGVKPKGRETANAYDRTIRDADDQVAELLRELAALGLEERTIVVLLSDHGEALSEHGSIGHSFSRFQEVLRVPLVFRGPGIRSGHVVSTPVSLVDVTPTILDLLALPPLATSQGISLAPALRGEPLPEDRPLYFSWLAEGALGVRKGRWKYVTGSKSSLYDLARDPAERQPLPTKEFAEGPMLLDQHREASAALRARVEAATVSAPSTVETISEGTERALRALGYIE